MVGVHKLEREGQKSETKKPPTMSIFMIFDKESEVEVSDSSKKLSRLKLFSSPLGQ